MGPRQRVRISNPGRKSWPWLGPAVDRAFKRRVCDRRAPRRRDRGAHAFSNRRQVSPGQLAPRIQILRAGASHVALLNDNVARGSLDKRLDLGDLVLSHDYKPARILVHMLELGYCQLDRLIAVQARALAAKASPRPPLLGPQTSLDRFVYLLQKRLIPSDPPLLLIIHGHNPRTALWLPQPSGDTRGHGKSACICLLLRDGEPIATASRRRAMAGSLRPEGPGRHHRRPAPSCRGARRAQGSNRRSTARTFARSEGESNPMPRTRCAGVDQRAPRARLLLKTAAPRHEPGTRAPAPSTPPSLLPAQSWSGPLGERRPASEFAGLPDRSPTSIAASPPWRRAGSATAAWTS